MLAHDALKAEPTGVLKNPRAIASDVLDILQTAAWVLSNLAKRRLRSMSGRSR
jgi:hypothetical protein